MLGEGEHGDEWDLQRIGTETEKMHARRELELLREKLAQVDDWKARHAEIEAELGEVWVEGAERPVGAPAYVSEPEEEERAETEAEETHDEADYQEAQEEIGEETETETEEGEVGQGSSGVIV